MMETLPLKITLVEDIAPQRLLIASVLRRAGHHVTNFEHAEAMSDSDMAQADLLVTDIDLPGESGLSLASRFRASRPTAGIVMLTVLDQPDDKVNGYAHGADVYLTKPIDPNELTAVVGALSRRLHETRMLTTAADALILNTAQLTLQGEQKTVFLSQHEAKILSHLAHAPDHLLELTQILDLLQIEQSPTAKPALEVRIVRLRKKIRAAGYTLPSIKNIRHRGYQLLIPLRIV
jgi:DNA-binding response OmpR family regulator